MNNTTVDVRTISFSLSSSGALTLDSTLQMGNKMSTSNDELLLFNAARDGKLEVVKELLSKGTGTGYRSAVSLIII